MHAMVGLATMTGTIPMANPVMPPLKNQDKSRKLITDAPTDIGVHLIDHITGRITGLTRIRGMGCTIERGPDIIMPPDQYIFIHPLRQYTHHHRR